jgi:CheY-like chemotaxis protein
VSAQSTALRCRAAGAEDGQYAQRSAHGADVADLRVIGRPLEFLHAFSADEAIRVLEQRRDVAVVLLDVVMEGEDAGLKAIEHIRNELRLSALRIILRTGQPGYAPELEAIANFDINDYKTKTELTRGKLFTTITAAIRSFEQIRRLEASRCGLELIIAGTGCTCRSGRTFSIRNCRKIMDRCGPRRMCGSSRPTFQLNGREKC